MCKLGVSVRGWPLFLWEPVKQKANGFRHKKTTLIGMGFSTFTQKAVVSD
jgi:hypothetical protein